MIVYPAYEYYKKADKIQNQLFSDGKLNYPGIDTSAFQYYPATNILRLVHSKTAAFTGIPANYFTKITMRLRNNSGTSLSTVTIKIGESSLATKITIGENEETREFTIPVDARVKDQTLTFQMFGISSNNDLAALAVEFT